MTASMVIWDAANSRITSSTYLIISGSRAEMGSSKSMMLGCIAKVSEALHHDNAQSSAARLRRAWQP